MRVILDRMPFSASEDEIIVRNERVRIKPFQIIVWVSLSRGGLDFPSPSRFAFPAILDTGYNHSFALTERHLVEWAGINPDRLLQRGHIRDRGQRVPLRFAELWGHANRRSSLETIDNRGAVLLATDEGIAIYPGTDFPRLPIFGLRAIAQNNLKLTIDGQRRTATLATGSRWWPF